MAPIVYNVAIIFGAVFLAPSMGIYGLAVGVVIGAAGHFLIQLGPLAQDRLPLQPASRPARSPTPARRCC